MASSLPSGRLPGSLIPFTDREMTPSPRLPAPLTPLLGRHEEVVQIRALLDSGETRLVTLTGPGGTGKTRLALQVAAELADDFAHGVCFVPLAAIHDAELVAPAIARTLGVREGKDRPVTQILTELLHERHLLLVLDNLEQVIAAAPWLAELLGACPRLTILATSRTPLHVRGEQRFPIPPLPVPGGEDPRSVASLSGYAAVTLFVQRARAVQPEFVLSEANAETVANICRRLDGLPLAIELAAARVRILSPAALLARLTDRLALLTGGARDAPARLQTMRNAIAWSYDLLSPGEQSLFRRLAVFAGGFTLDAVETVANMEDRILDDVEALTDHSLLHQVPSENGTPRFAMLETIREYALDRLVAAGEEAAARDAHAAWFLGVASESERAMKGAGQVTWLDRLEVEHDNLRAVFAWLAQRGRIEEAMDLAGAIWFFRWIRGYYTEGRTQFETLLAHPDAQRRTIPRGKALNGMGITALSQGDHARSLESHNEALAIFREHGDREYEALALLCMGATLMARGDLDQSDTVSAESLSLARTLDDPWAIAAALGNLGTIAASRNEPEKASALMNESIAFGRRAGDRWLVALDLGNLAGLALNRGHHEQATALVEESHSLIRELGDKRDLPYGMLLLGEIARRQGDFALAATHYRESLAVSRETGDKQLIGYSLMSLGSIAALQGETGTATRLLGQSVTLFQQVGLPAGVAECLDEFAAILVAERRLEPAARLFGAADRLLTEIGMPRPEGQPADEYERRVAGIRSRLGETAYARAWASGEAMTLDEAVTEAAAIELSPIARAAMAEPAIRLETHGLSPRETDVLRLMADGLTNQEIADTLFISHRTATSHVTNVLGKLNLRTRTAAVAYAIRQGLA